MLGKTGVANITDIKALTVQNQDVSFCWCKRELVKSAGYSPCSHAVIQADGGSTRPPRIPWVQLHHSQLEGKRHWRGTQEVWWADLAAESISSAHTPPGLVYLLWRLGSAVQLCQPWPQNPCHFLPGFCSGPHTGLSPHPIHTLQCCQSWFWNHLLLPSEQYL